MAQLTRTASQKNKLRRTSFGAAASIHSIQQGWQAGSGPHGCPPYERSAERTVARGLAASVCQKSSRSRELKGFSFVFFVRSSIRLLRLHLLYLRASLPAGYARSLPRREPRDTPQSSKTRQDKMNNNNRGNEDYLDKALDKVEQMAGRKVRSHPPSPIATRLWRISMELIRCANCRPARTSTRRSTASRTRRSRTRSGR